MADVTVKRLARILAIGGVPGRVYEAPEFTEEGAPPPRVGQGVSQRKRSSGAGR